MIDVLSDLFILRGIPSHIGFDNGPEFVAEDVQEWIAAVSAETAYIERNSPWENGYIESFNARLRDESIQSGPTPHSDTSRQHRRCSCPHSPRGPLRYVGLRRRSPVWMRWSPKPKTRA